MKEKSVKPMLAVQAEGEIKFPVYASSKIDGVRALVKGGKLLSRKMIEIPNEHVQKALGLGDLNGLDGELTVGPENARDVMQTTMSGVMTRSGYPAFTWWVFDYWTYPQTPFHERMRSLEYGFTKEFMERHPQVRLLPQTFIENAEQLELFERINVDSGFEGIMIRKVDGPYKYGRSTAKEGILLKLKRFQDDEAVVIGFEERMHNANPLQVDNLGHAKRSSHQENMVPMGTLGTLIGRDLQTGQEVRCGTGFDDAARKRIWDFRNNHLGMTFVYKHFAQTGVKDERRFPVFKAFRDPRDMSR